MPRRGEFYKGRPAPGLRAVRSERGLSIRALAESAGVSAWTVQRAERGLPLTTTTLHALAAALDVQASRLTEADADQPGRQRVEGATGSGNDPRPPLPPADLSLIVQTPDVCGSEARFAGTRLTVRSVLAFWRDGCTVEQIREQYPQVTAEDVAAAVEWEEQARASGKGGKPKPPPPPPPQKETTKIKQSPAQQGGDGGKRQQ